MQGVFLTGKNKLELTLQTRVLCILFSLVCKGPTVVMEAMATFCLYGYQTLFIWLPNLVRLATKPCLSGYQTVKHGSQRPVGKILDFRAFRSVY